MVLTRVLLLVFYELFLSIDLTSTQFTQFTTTATWLPNQCHQYTTINDRTRNVNANGSNECDTLFMSGSSWVRFIGESGTQLTTTPTNPNQCGAHSTGWYAGSMPDIYQTVTNGRVCFSWYNNICQWSNTIAVTNCGSFYIYQLTMPPLCAARYCTDTTNIPTATTTTTSIQPILSPQCYHYSTIDDPTRNVNYATGSNCDQRFFNSTPTWFRFEGVGGTQMPTSATTYNRCGTQATGWYSGQMPTYLDTTTNGTVCFAWQSSTCYGSQSIRVTNCGSYYVYELSAPSGCNYRYCTQTPSTPVTTTPVTTTRTTTPNTSILSAQCYDYSTIDDPTRNVNYATGGDCDQRFFNSTPTWFRFVGQGGTQMPTSAITYNRCGTAATGWYSGQMPTYLDTTTNGTVCFAFESGTCKWSQSIRVTNCGSYYVYELRAPSTCNLRYCTIHSSSVRQSNVASTSISNYIQSLVTKIGTMKKKILNKLAAIM